MQKANTRNTNEIEEMEQIPENDEHLGNFQNVLPYKYT